MKKILILGTSGMLGNSLYQNINNQDVYGIQRKPSEDTRIFSIEDFLSDDFIKLLDKIGADVIINCVGVIKQKENANNVLNTLPINSIFPHKLADYVRSNKKRLIHFSTDCIFDGQKGMYSDEDELSAKDVYGVSKYLGEVHHNPNVLTLRTSIIGHGVEKNESLIDWFMSQKGKKVKGYTEAYFSGLPCIEIASILSNFIILNDSLSGVYNLSTTKISKYELLKLVSKVYGIDVELEKSNDISIDRSLCSKRLKSLIGYKDKSWFELVNLMKGDLNNV